MDVNWQFWRREGETFAQRFWHWINILDPVLLFESKVKIDQARTNLLAVGDDVTESLQNKKMKEAWMLSLASVNAATGDIVPAVFRPPGRRGCCDGDLKKSHKRVSGWEQKDVSIATQTEDEFRKDYQVITALAPHTSTRNAFLNQLAFHGYTGGFALANGNAGKLLNSSTAEKETLQKHLLIGTSSVLYTAFVGSLPEHILLRRKLQSSSAQFLLRNIIPGQLTAILCAFNILLLRSMEFENGIEVMDSKGNVIGTSQIAGEKALKETAISRGVMVSTAVAIPEVIFSFFRRTKLSIEKPHIFSTLKSVMVITMLGLMIPVSFSWMPQAGKIERCKLEPEIVSSTEETELFYNRGL